MATPPIDRVGPDPSRLPQRGGHPRRDRGEEDDRAKPRGSRLDDADEVLISADAAALVAGEPDRTSLFDGVGEWLGRHLWRLSQALFAPRLERPAPPGRAFALPDSPAAPPGAADRRVHERFESRGLTVRIDSTVYDILDVSLGGFTFGPDLGHLIAGQRFYCQLRFPGDHPGDPMRTDGKVVRVHDGVIAAKFFLPLATTRRVIAAFVAHSRGAGDG